MEGLPYAQSWAVFMASSAAFQELEGSLTFSPVTQTNAISLGICPPHPSVPGLAGTLGRKGTEFLQRSIMNIGHT